MLSVIINWSPTPYLTSTLLLLPLRKGHPTCMLFCTNVLVCYSCTLLTFCAVFFHFCETFVMLQLLLPLSFITTPLFISTCVSVARYNTQFNRLFFLIFLIRLSDHYDDTIHQHGGRTTQTKTENIKYANISQNMEKQITRISKTIDQGSLQKAIQKVDHYLKKESNKHNINITIIITLHNLSHYSTAKIVNTQNASSNDCARSAKNARARATGLSEKQNTFYFT